MDLDADPDPDAVPDPAIFISDLQDVNKKNVLTVFCLLKLHLHHFSKIKSHKVVAKK